MAFVLLTTLASSPSSRVLLALAGGVLRAVAIVAAAPWLTAKVEVS